MADAMYFTLLRRKWLMKRKMEAMEYMRPDSTTILRVLRSADSGSKRVTVLESRNDALVSLSTRQIRHAIPPSGSHTVRLELPWKERAKLTGSVGIEQQGESEEYRSGKLKRCGQGNHTPLGHGHDMNAQDPEKHSQAS